MLTAHFTTSEGNFSVRLFDHVAPNTVANFVGLAEGTKEFTDPKTGQKVKRPFYDGLIFHRVIAGFMIQGGDPNGDGTGGESAWGGKFPDDINVSSDLYKGGYKRGLVAMANAGPNTNGSQFFIMHQDYRLPPAYVIFGKVTKGMEVVDALANTPTERGKDGGMSQPLSPVVMKKVTIRP